VRRSLFAAAAALAVLALPAAASAQTSGTAPPTPTPAKPEIALRPVDTLRDGHSRVQVAGRSFGATGTLTPYVAGEKVTVLVVRDGKVVRHLHPRVRSGPSGRSGVFAVSIKRRTPGRYALRAVHTGTAALARAHSAKLRVRLVDGSIAAGHGGAAVRLLQRGLRRLHYAASRSGVYDAATARAVMAWRKVTRRARVYSADRSVLLGVLDGKGAWKVRHPRAGHHVEADISLQVLALVDGRKVVRIEHLSSGKPSTPTVLGRFRVYLKQPGTNSHGMVDSSYFIRGYAIHGYASVPTYNASHGCLRVPIPDARAIYDWVHMGDVVWVEP
jgi:L,D-transpeptidase-like protein